MRAQQRLGGQAGRGADGEQAGCRNAERPFVNLHGYLLIGQIRGICPTQQDPMPALSQP
jgi:hypothetical protein